MEIKTTRHYHIPTRLYKIKCELTQCCWRCEFKQMRSLWKTSSKWIGNMPRSCPSPWPLWFQVVFPQACFCPLCTSGFLQQGFLDWPSRPALSTLSSSHPNRPPSTLPTPGQLAFCPLLSLGCSPPRMAFLQAQLSSVSFFPPDSRGWGTVYILYNSWVFSTIQKVASSAFQISRLFHLINNLLSSW